jgi:hypothetical protein
MKHPFPSKVRGKFHQFKRQYANDPWERHSAKGRLEDYRMMSLVLGCSGLLTRQILQLSKNHHHACSVTLAVFYHGLSPVEQHDEQSSVMCTGKDLVTSKASKGAYDYKHVLMVRPRHHSLLTSSQDFPSPVYTVHCIVVCSISQKCACQTICNPHSPAIIY